MIRERSADILDAAVAQFIETGLPVSSSLLYSRYDFGIKPAMIRFELNELTDQGFLEQPYHSGGRVPQDKGFEFFARRRIEKTGPRASVSAMLQELFREQSWPDLLNTLSREMGTFSVVSSASGKTVYKEGLTNLIDHIEWDSREAIRRIIQDCEQIEDHLSDAKSIFEDAQDLLQVFIGRRSPLTKSEHLALMGTDYEIDGQKYFLFIIGPKRMDYQKGANILQGLKKLESKN